jgi:hypothetical protein
MAVGDVKHFANAKKAICLMTAQTANTGAPAAATDGVPCFPVVQGAGAILNAASGHCFTGMPAASSTLMIGSSAGSGTMVGTFTLWGYLTASGQWYPVAVNDGAALAETANDAIRFTERFPDLGHYDRLFLQLASVGGTDTAFEAWLVTGSEAF